MSEPNETGPYLLEFFYWRTRDGRKLYTRWTRRRIFRRLEMVCNRGRQAQ